MKLPLARKPAAPGRLRVRTPTVLQMEGTECGAAALGSVLAWHGRHVPLEELRLACGVSRDGSNASNLLKAARSYGLEAKGYKKEPEDLRGMALPVIVFWNFGHFLVVEGFGKDVVYLNDPATGPRKVSLEEFDRSFTGVVLTFEKGARFEAGGQPPSAWRALSRRLGDGRAPLVFIILCTLALVLPGLVAPVYSRVFLDQIFTESSTGWLRPLLALMVGTALLTALLTWLQGNALLRLQGRLAISSSCRFVWHIFKLPMEFFSQRHAGDVIQRVDANQQVAALLSGGLTRNAVNLLMVGFYAVLMVLYDTSLAAIAVATALGQLLVLRWVARHRVDENRRLAQEQGKLLGVGMTGLQMIETLKATGGEQGFFSRWAGYQARLLNSTNRFAESSIWFTAAPALLGAASAAAILGVGGIAVIDGALTVGMFVAFQALTASFLAPVSGLVGLGDSVQNLQGALARLDDVIEYAPDAAVARGELEERGPGDGYARLEGEVELRNVTFGYSPLAPPLLRDFSLHVQPGRRVALVGASGSGKSTVAKLVAGLYKPWTGEILFDGKPRESLPRAVVTGSVALVDQDISLFSGTVRENIALWDPTLDEREIVQAARDACIHGDITEKAGGYGQKLQEGGHNLSVGQRQRLEIARALAGNPRVLVLDEASSALDPATEKMVDDNLRRRGCTLLIIAHRLSTIRDCDEIIVMKGGRIVQRGTHESMVGVPGPYAALISAE